MTTTSVAGPRVRVTRDSFFAGLGGHLRWTEASPAAGHRHGADCGCTIAVDAKPAGRPESIRQEIRIAWNDCVIALEEGASEPWVTFRKAGDAEGWIDRRRSGDGDEADEDHAYVIFDDRQDKAKLEVTSAGFGLVDCVLVDLFLGNQVDTSTLRNGFSPSRVVDLAKIGPDEPWIYADETMRTLGTAQEIALVRDAFRLAREVRRLARSHLLARDTPVESVRAVVEDDRLLLASAAELRQVLSPIVLGVERTDLFRLAAEMETELEEKRSCLRSRA
ncbi:MAG TPA: hypothetical protein VLE97_10980 [Gaiellaceae bacterium]|nr:hypothetical protein [Gaiellaceae bacterium]